MQKYECQFPTYDFAIQMFYHLQSVFKVLSILAPSQIWFQGKQTADMIQKLVCCLLFVDGVI